MSSSLRAELAETRKLNEELLDALYSALPFVEDAVGSQYYRKGFPEQMVKRIKSAIARCEAKK